MTSTDDPSQASATDAVVTQASSHLPPVVAVMVVHRPGAGLTETARSLAAQDYSQLQILALVSGTSVDEGAVEVTDTLATELPNAVIRYIGSNPGFPSAVNSVIDLVEGESGYFCLMHDDVVLAPDAVSRLVEEMFRTNAGVVAPKLVTWDDPSVIDSVGDEVDRIGERDSIATVGERDQEQHDAVRDVFCVSSACILVRADLFKLIGGFEPSLQIAGADLDFCWRAHIGGARVVVAPSAVVRHRSVTTERLISADERRYEMQHETERMRTVLSLTSRGALPLITLRLVVFTIGLAALSLVSGRPQRSWVLLRALFSLPGSIRSVIDRRRRVARLRLVDDDEVHALQVRGSARIRSWYRRRANIGPRTETEVNIVGDAVVTTQRSSAALWLVLVALTVVGGRSLLTDGSATIGQFVPFRDGVGSFLEGYRSGWWSAGLGSGVSVPTGTALTWVWGTLFIGKMALAHTMAIVLLPVIGYWGAWVFASVFGVRRARIITTLAYAAVPLPYACMSAGRWSGLVVYALLPWTMHFTRVLVGHRAVSLMDPSDHHDSFEDASVDRRVRAFSALVLVVAIAFAFEPAFVMIFMVTAGVFAVMTLVNGSPRRSLSWVGVASSGVIGALVLNLPWTGNFLSRNWWEQFTGAPVEGGRGLGIAALATFDVGRTPLGRVFLLVYVVVAASVLLVRGSRAPWAVRGATLVVTGLLIASLDDKALVPAHLAEPAVMLVPVAFGIAICAGALGASLGLDVRHARFGWRQPLGALATVSFILGLAPTALAGVNGRWSQPEVTVAQLLEQLPGPEAAGAYRTLFLGDSRLLPGAPENVGWGVSYSVVENGRPTTDNLWESTPTVATASVTQTTRGIVRGSTARAGRLLAPFAIKYIVVPVIDDVVSTRTSVLSVSDTIIDMLGDQLDLRRRYSSAEVAVFENMSWAPLVSQLTEAGAASSKSAGAISVIAGDMSGSTEAMVEEGHSNTYRGTVQPGTVHFAVPFSSAWTLSINGYHVVPRPAFGLSTAFDVTEAGTAKLSYDTSIIRRLGLPIQFALWCVAFFFAVSRRRVRSDMDPVK